MMGVELDASDLDWLSQFEDYASETMMDSIRSLLSSRKRLRQAAQAAYELLEPDMRARPNDAHNEFAWMESTINVRQQLRVALGIEE